MGRRVREAGFTWPVHGIRVIDLVSKLVSACFRISRKAPLPHFDGPAQGIRNMGSCFRLASRCFRIWRKVLLPHFDWPAQRIRNMASCFQLFPHVSAQRGTRPRLHFCCPQQRFCNSDSCFRRGVSPPKKVKREEAWLPRALHSARGNTLPLFANVFERGLAHNFQLVSTCCGQRSDKKRKRVLSSGGLFCVARVGKAA